MSNLVWSDALFSPALQALQDLQAAQDPPASSSSPPPPPGAPADLTAMYMSDDKLAPYPVASEEGADAAVVDKEGKLVWFKMKTLLY